MVTRILKVNSIYLMYSVLVIGVVICKKMSQLCCFIKIAVFITVKSMKQ